MGETGEERWVEKRGGGGDADGGRGKTGKENQGGGRDSCGGEVCVCVGGGKIALHFKITKACAITILLLAPILKV